MLATIFWTFFSLAIISGIMVISAKNPVHCVLHLILVFFDSTALLIILGVDFIGLLLLIVYIGAIAVLFLFCVMMLNIKLVEFNENLSRFLPLGLVVGLVFLFQVFALIDTDLGSSISSPFLFDWTLILSPLTSIQNIGLLLYTTFSFPFILCGLILLLALLGAIILTLHHKPSVRRQDLYSQLSSSSFLPHATS